MSQFGRSLCGLCGTYSTHTRETANEPWVCIHHSPTQFDAWGIEREALRRRFAGFNAFQLRELADDLAKMLDYQAAKIEKEQHARLWVKGAA